MVLDVRHLEMVQAIVEEGTLTRASERLFLTQPALSHQLRQVEQRLGAALFERKGRGLTLSVAGARVLRSARLVLDEIRRAEADVRSLAEGRAGTLRLSMECYTTYHWLPTVLRRYREAYPDVDVELRVEATRMPTDFLLRGELDVAVVIDPRNNIGSLTMRHLFDDEVVAIVPAGHPWAEHSFIEAEAFRTEHLMVYRAALNDALFRHVLGPANVEPAKLTILPMSTEAVVEMVKARLGITAMARWAAEPYLAAGDLTAVRITREGLARSWYAATRAEAQPRYVRAFLEHLVDLSFEAFPVCEGREGASLAPRDPCA